MLSFKIKDSKNQKTGICILLLVFAIIIGIVSGCFASNGYYSLKIRICEKRYNQVQSDDNLLKLAIILSESKDVKYVQYLDALLLMPKESYESLYQKFLSKKNPSIEFDSDVYNQDFYHALIISYAFSICNDKNDDELLRTVFLKYYPKISYSYHIFALENSFINLTTPDNGCVYDNRDTLIKALEEIYSNEQDAATQFEYLTTICAFYSADKINNYEKQLELNFRLKKYRELFKYEDKENANWDSNYKRDVDMWNAIL